MILVMSSLPAGASTKTSKDVAWAKKVAAITNSYASSWSAADRDASAGRWVDLNGDAMEIYFDAKDLEALPPAPTHAMQSAIHKLAVDSIAMANDFSFIAQQPTAAHVKVATAAEIVVTRDEAVVNRLIRTLPT
jgi:hypothetical protein